MLSHFFFLLFAPADLAFCWFYFTTTFTGCGWVFLLRILVMSRSTVGPAEPTAFIPVPISPKAGCTTAPIRTASPSKPSTYLKYSPAGFSSYGTAGGSLLTTREYSSSAAGSYSGDSEANVANWSSGPGATSTINLTFNYSVVWFERPDR